MQGYDYTWGGQLEMVGLVAIATVLGGVIGWEREARGRPAGLRTHMLVAGATATIAAIGRTVFFDAGGHMGDPNRALQAAIMGIGFLGAGTILQREASGRVEGLTTAASLFFTAAVGVGTGNGLVPLAVGATVIVVVVVGVVRLVERRLVETPRRRARSGGS